MLLYKGAAGGEIVRIKNAVDFSSFVSNVGSNIKYEGTTVYLDTDLSLTEKTLEPIGNGSRYFSGTFDGQGYIISDLKMNVTSVYTGLFGYSKGLTIKNVVLDSSCFISNSYNGSNDVYLGGIIGHCGPYYGQCNIENSVNMADTTFSGNISGYNSLYLGGIAGYLRSSGYVKNCANYGSVTYSGTSRYSYIGGIAGYLYDYCSNNICAYLYNCLNHGTITHSGTTSTWLYIGGNAGYAYSTHIENCVSAGKIFLTNGDFIGSIAGYASSDTSINYCYYTSELSEYSSYGGGTPTNMAGTTSYDNVTFKLSDTVSIGSSTKDTLIDALNAYSDYYVLRDCSKWLLNKDSKSVKFTINSRANPITMDYKIVILPTLASEGTLMFDGWYTDSNCKNLLQSFEITGDKELYGRFKENTKEYTITFDTRKEGVSVAPITAQLGTVVSLPNDLTRGHCNISFWENDYGDNVGLSLTMPAHNFTLYAVWKCTRITTPDDLIDFSSLVKSRTTYSGTTVYLDSDLSLTGKTLEPIGKDDSNYFLGTFDGQGHIISNLKMDVSSSSYYTGLFGYSKGLTIKNVVLDSSCSITSSYNGSRDVYAGGIVGYCKSGYGQCTIENIVNMADVTFSGDVSSYLYLGGIVGYLYPDYSYYNVYVKNCANYGSITYSGTSYRSYIGGIVGYFDDYSSSYYTYIQNCLNYGAITHSGKTSNDLYLGGIAGLTSSTYIENCLSAGKISSTKTNYLGSIVGQVNSYTYINYCYYANDTGTKSICGKGTPQSTSYTFNYDNATFGLGGYVSIGSYIGDSLVDALNAYSGYYLLHDYSNWLLNKDGKNAKFTINSRANPITMDYKIILLPSLASEGNITFDGWYTDSNCKDPLQSFEVTEDKELYGKFEENTNSSYIITFDTKKDGVHIEPQTARYLAVVSLPSDSTREHCSVAWWESEYGYNFGFSFTMPAHDVTLYAVWKCTRITTPDDLIDFSKVVNKGNHYYGTTVYLDSDLSLNGKTLGPIGNETYKYFYGTFDGQGHIISDLKMTSSSSQNIGLFGYSQGLTIKNVVLDSSCSISNSYSGSNVYLGGIIGHFRSGYAQCTIENVVNMADVTISEYTSSYNSLYLGGIAGYLSSSGYVKNCANYGSVTHSGTTSSRTSYIGGIVGYLDGSSSNHAYLYNCLNYGAIIHSGTTSNTLYIGGITGYSNYAYIENCVSAGKISTPTTATYRNYIGSIVGEVYSRTYINYCYYTSGLSEYAIYGYAYSLPNVSYTTSYNNVTFGLGDTVSIGSSTKDTLIDALNAYSDYYVLRDCSKWLFNKDSKSVKFTINSRTNPITMDYKIVILPTLASEGTLMFDGWYTDSNCKNPLQSFEITEDKELYGRFEENTKEYIITFDTRKEGVSVAPITAQLGTVVSLPSDSIRSYCNVAWWENEYGDNVGLSLAMPAHNFTLYAVWKCTRITTPDDLIDFSKVVNSGTTYYGTTVYLDSDLSLTGKTLEPIGKETYKYFNGVFDGQGYIISNLKMSSSSSEHAGLFWHSYGLTIKNVVLDSSCSITSSYNGSIYAYLGGIIGYCATSNGECTIENSVNMADVTFSSNYSGSNFLYLGGVVGYFLFSYYNIYVKNCANYGSVTHSGTSWSSYIGGIAGILSGSSSIYAHLYNCLNYGAITHNGTTSGNLYIGGIAGYASSARIENCVSAGKISTPTTATYNYIGSIVGQVYSGAYINYCYYTSDVGEYQINGTGTPESIEGTPDSPTTADLSLVGNLNSRVTSDNGWSKWLLNTNNKAVTFKMNANDDFSLSSTLIILPNLANGWRTFVAWFTDNTFTTLFSGSSVSTDTTLYGRWDIFTVTFDGNGGNVSEISRNVTYNSAYGELPEANRTGCTFNGWFTKRSGGTKVTNTTLTSPSDHAIYAHWNGLKYTVTLDVNGGDELSDNKVTVTFDEVYGKLPTPKRKGYTFAGWFTDNNVIVTGETVVSIAGDHTLHARWTEGESSQAESSSDKADYVGALYPLVQLVYFLV